MPRTNPGTELRSVFGRLLATVLACLLSAAHADEPLRNQLRDHSSPYLKLHGEDPVAWQDWGRAAFDTAQADGRLILVSVGYFACHWCHVMQRESYRNADIAARLNADFVAIKVDRERHPGIDARLIDFAERTVGRAGWPLNVFLTPDGYPLVAALYEPPARFAALLDRLAARWHSDPQGLRKLAVDAYREMESTASKQNVVPPIDTASARAALFRTALEYADTISGGFGQQAKFPMVPVLDALLNGCEQGDAPEDVCTFLITTLDHMAALGMHDHLHGGFFRYTVDPDWRTPHFEKMLYDNAQLAELYLRAAAHFERDDYVAIAFQTLDFVLTRMAAPDGGYISSLSAIDANGQEGGDYLWTREQLEDLLSTAQFMRVSQIWDLRDPVGGVNGFLPRTLPSDASPNPEYEAAMAKLREARAPYRPPRDDKVLAAWNGLLLRALVMAAGHEGGSRFQAPADALAEFVQTRFITPAQALRVAGDARVPATLEDYVLLADGLDRWATWRNDGAAHEQVAIWLKAAEARFHVGSGWRKDTDALLRYGQASPILADDAMPSVSAIWLRLARPDDAQSWRDAQAATANDPFSYPSHIVLMPALRTGHQR